MPRLSFPMPLQKIISCNFRIIEKNQEQHHTGFLVQSARLNQPCEPSTFLFE